MNIVRRNRPASALTLDAALVSLTFPPTCVGSDPTEALLLIRRTGCCDDWLLAYPLFGYTQTGDLDFRLDGEVHKLPEGYYDAVIVRDCLECASVRLTKPYCPAIDVARAAPVLYTPAPEPGGPISGVEPMFENYYSYSTKTTCVLPPTGLTIQVSDPVVVPLVAPMPQLTLRDGVNSEVVTLVSASADGLNLTVTRGAPALKFPACTTVQFEWTPANVAAVATPADCPECPPDSGDGSACGGYQNTVLVPGCGISLQTNEQGQVVIGLSPSGAAPGEYGGLYIDECGRVSHVDAAFPASAVPVFDPCCPPPCDNDDEVEAP